MDKTNSMSELNSHTDKSLKGTFNDSYPNDVFHDKNIYCSANNNFLVIMIFLFLIRGNVNLTPKFSFHTDETLIRSFYNDNFLDIFDRKLCLSFKKQFINC